MNQVCCAHSKVELKHHEYPDGTRSDYWECAEGCGKQFFPEHVDLNTRNLRDYFAGQALQGQIASFSNPEVIKAWRDLWPTLDDAFAHCASSAYRFADAMLAARNKNLHAS